VSIVRDEGFASNFDPTPEQRAAVAKAYRLIDPDDPLVHAFIQMALEANEFEHLDYPAWADAIVAAIKDGPDA
jgi:hypothetical protein